MMLDAPAPEVLARSYTLDEYLALPKGRPYYELENGRLVALLSTNFAHGKWMGRIFTHIDRWASEHGGLVSLEVGTLPGGANGYIPDVVYLSPRHKRRLKKGRCQGPPTLAVEVHGRRGRRRDGVEKRKIYARMGLEWYWLVDYHAGTFTELHLVDGVYEETASAGRGEEFRPRGLPGLVIVVDEIDH